MKIPEPIQQFLSLKTIAVAGVSRQKHKTGNAVFRRLRKSGYIVYPVNPNAGEVEGEQCYSDLGSLPQRPDGVVAVTTPEATTAIVEQCVKQDVRHIWMHRSIGPTSVSDEGVRMAAANAMNCIPGGCPLMFCEPVDFAHKCIRWWIGRKGGLGLPESSIPTGKKELQS